MRKSFAAWLAIVALSLQALWPLLAQAIPQVRGHLVPLCTVDGVTHYVEIPAGGSSGEQRSASFHEHCKFCVFGVDRLAAIVPAPLPPLRVETAGDAGAVPVAVAHVPSHSAPPAPARAPPALS